MEIRKRIPPSLCSIFPHLKLSSAHLAPLPPTISSPSTTSPALCLFHWLIKPTPVDRGWRYFPNLFLCLCVIRIYCPYGVGNPIFCSLMDDDGEIDYTIWYLFSVNGVFVKILFVVIFHFERRDWLLNVVLSMKFCLDTKILRMLPFNRFVTSSLENL